MSNDLPPPPPERAPPVAMPNAIPHAPPPLPPAAGDPVRYHESAGSGLGVLVPTKNPHSLWSYYLGIFSLFPCLGVATGVTAVILGVMAIKRFNANPAIRGRTHAIVGIVAGALCVVIQIVLVIVIAGIGSAR